MDNMMQETIHVAMITTGGAGSLFIYANFLYHMKAYLKDEPVEYVVIGHKSEELNQFVFGDGKLTKEYYSAGETDRAMKCDVAFEINFYPRVLFEDDSVEERAPRLHKLLTVWRNFYLNDRARNFLMTNLHRDHNTYIYGRIMGKTFLNIGDIDGMLGIGNEFAWRVELKEPENTLMRFGLKPNQYITIQCGATPGIHTKTSPKQWPVHRYEELIPLLRKLYPEKIIVQLGEAGNSDSLRGVDMNLLGQTSWEELAAVLKYAWLHIDGECGMVHLREMLGSAPSVVLFGPTPMEFYAYQNNINICSYACTYPCARLTDYWLERCMLGHELPPCMERLTAGQVMESIVEWDCLNRLSKGERLCFQNEKLYHDPDIIIDAAYKAQYLDYLNIYLYELVQIPLKDLQCCVMGERDFEWMPLKDTPAYRMLTENEQVYEDYAQLLQKNNNDYTHNVARYKKLLSSIREEGFDERNRIIVDGRNRIRDGQHRAAILADKNGLDYGATVLKIHILTLFPFDRVERGSRILLYGAGGVGYDYLMQIEAADYCHVVAMVDRMPFLWNENEKKREKAICISPKEIMQYQGQYDKIVISSTNDKFVDEIMEQLKKLGISGERIISRYRPV